MRKCNCPHCKRSYWDWESTLAGKKMPAPVVHCARCGKTYKDPAFVELALKPFQPPRKYQAFLSGLWPFGVLGLLAIIAGMLINKPLVVIVGGLAMSLWMLLVAMSLCLWQEVCNNARKAYDESLERIKGTSRNE